MNRIFIVILSLALAACSNSNFASDGSSTASEKASLLDGVERAGVAVADVLLGVPSTGAPSNLDALLSVPPAGATPSLGDYMVKCERIRALSTVRQLTASQDLITFRGNLIAQAESIGQITDSMGNIILYGTTSASKIKLLRNFFGNLIVCNLDIEAIETNMGNLIVINGNIGPVSDHKGNLIVAGGSVGSVSDSTGNIVIRGGNIGDISRVRGNIVVRQGSAGDVTDFSGNLVVFGGGVGTVQNSRGNIRTDGTIGGLVNFTGNLF